MLSFFVGESQSKKQNHVWTFFCRNEWKLLWKSRLSAILSNFNGVLCPQTAFMNGKRGQEGENCRFGFSLLRGSCCFLRVSTACGELC
jgi:hypothetical protein